MADACYCRRNGTLKSSLPGGCDDYTPCSSGDGKIVTCCGSGAVCGSNGFCFYIGGSAAHNTSGYYLGGCTDPNFASPLCPIPCADYGRSDVMWLPDQKKWKCCGAKGSNNIDCWKNNGQTFKAPAPIALAFSQASGAASSASAPAAAASTDGRGLAQPSATPASTIVLAVVLPIVLLATALLALLYFRQKRRASSRLLEQSQYLPSATMNNSSETALKGTNSSSPVPNEISSESVMARPKELEPYNGMIREMGPNNRINPSELDGRGAGNNINYF